MIRYLWSLLLGQCGLRRCQFETIHTANLLGPDYSGKEANIGHVYTLRCTVCGDIQRRTFKSPS
jgi:hypothetical protein